MSKCQGQSGGSLKKSAQTSKERVPDECCWHEGGEANNILMKMTTCIRKVF
jgi:hypothetical protein